MEKVEKKIANFDFFLKKKVFLGKEIVGCKHFHTRHDICTLHENIFSGQHILLSA